VPLLLPVPASPTATDVAAIEAIYGAAAAPERWPEALDRIAACFEAEGTALIFQRGASQFSAIVSPRLAEAGRDYEAGWGARDISAARTRAKFNEGYAVITERDTCTPEEIATHPFFTDFLVRHGLGCFMATEVAPGDDMLVCISVQRNRAKGPFDQADIARVVPLGRHVEQALRLTVRLVRSESTSLVLGEALSRLSCGVVLLDRKQRVLFANRRAQALLGTEFEVSGAALASIDRASQQQLYAALAAPTTMAGAPQSLVLKSSVRAADRSQSPPMMVFLLPVQPGGHSTAADIFGTSSTMVLIIESSPDAPPDAAMVRDLLGLTLGEARVAALIGSGQSPQRAAKALDITEATARTVLKRVFGKVGVSRQSELTALLARLARLGPEPG